MVTEERDEADAEHDRGEEEEEDVELPHSSPRVSLKNSHHRNG